VTLLVVTADDFGAAVEVNEAVEIAHERGILTAASLMVAGAAVADAIERARRLPRLGVGLHLDLTEGRPVLSVDRVPDLVGRDGRFRTNLGLTGLRVATSGRVREQMRAEIDAQFAAFAATRLTFDHVNAHRHFHVHPVIAGMVLEAASRYGVRALRAPVEHGWPSGSGWLAVPFARSLRRRARRRGILVPDQVFGLAASGHMTKRAVQCALDHLQGGLNELYLHPALSDDFVGHGPGYQHRAEFDGLIDAECIDMVRQREVRLGCFGQHAPSSA
jgi:hopanoid biosynthesis associated protein HpnK